MTGNPAIADWARQAGLTVHSPGSVLSDGWSGPEFDWFFSIANLRMIPNEIWQRARRGAINFHDGPLPAYAGLNTPAWDLINGETTHAVTWHAIVDGVDRGEIYLQREIEISKGETALTLNTKCFEAGMSSFADLCTLIEKDRLFAQVNLDRHELELYTSTRTPGLRALTGTSCSPRRSRRPSSHL